MILFDRSSISSVLSSAAILNGDEPINVLINVVKHTAGGVLITCGAFGPAMSIETDAPNKEDCACMFVEAFKQALSTEAPCDLTKLEHITLHLVTNEGGRLSIWYAWAI